MTTVEDVYQYEPVPEELTKEEAQHVLGGQGQIWTEYMATPKDVEWMAFPRVLALAETLWTSPDGKDYQDFMKRFPQLLKQLDLMDVRYYRKFV